MADSPCQNRCLAENIAMPLQRLAYCLCVVCAVLLLGWGTIAELLVHAPGVYERLMQVQETGRHGWKLV